MKKIIFLLIFLLIPLCSCSKDDGITQGPIHSHNYSSNVIDPTCEDEGYTLYSCSCGDTYKDNYVAELGHNYGIWVEVEKGDCDNPGTKKRICSICQDEEYEDIIYDNHTDSNGVCTICDKKLYSTGLAYELSNNSYKLVGMGLCNDTELIIPSNYNNLPVTSIGFEAFKNNTSIKSVIVTNTIKEIGFASFLGCSSLETVEFSSDSTLEYINANAFNGCSSLTDIIIPKSVCEIGYYAFYNCTSLTTLSFEEQSNLTKLDAYSFSSCTLLTEITIPNSITELNEGVFENCTSLENVIIDCRIESIPKKLFWRCVKLKETTIPDSVIKIEEYSFDGCTSLTNINFKGLESKWNSIIIEDYNDSLDEVIINYVL